MAFEVDGVTEFYATRTTMLREEAVPNRPKQRPFHRFLAKSDDNACPVRLGSFLVEQKKSFTMQRNGVVLKVGVI